ncbi:MAG TPA: extracellular solute-binding protein [Anaerolineae bacterium]|nr:extracellular solute-binding protein [Anaerolineae bacterium]
MAATKLSRREFLRQTALVGASVLAASCAPPVVERTVVVEPTKPAPPEKVVKVIPFLTEESDPDSIKVYQQIAAEFRDEHPDVAIDLVTTNAPDVLLQRIQQAVAVGAELGIFTINDFTYAEVAPEGLLLPLDEIYEDVGADKWYPGAATGLPDGHMYALAYSGGFYTVLWARSDMMEKEGLGDPTTFEETLELVKALTQDTNGDGEIDIYGAGIPTSNIWCTGCAFTSALYANCGDYFDDQGNVVFDHPNALEAVKRYATLAEYAPDAASSWSWGDIIQSFIAKRTATCWYYGRAGWNTYRADPELRAKMKPLAFITGEKDLGFGSFDKLAVYSKVKWPKEALEFVKFMLTGDRVVRFLLTVPGHLSPPYAGLEELVLKSDHPYIKEYGEQVAFLFSRAGKGASPSSFMGFIDPDTCEPDFTLQIVPWGGRVFGGHDSVPALVIQRIAVKGETPEQAHQWGVEEFKKRVDEWKSENPDWKPPTT